MKTKTKALHVFAEGAGQKMSAGHWSNTFPHHILVLRLQVDFSITRSAWDMANNNNKKKILVQHVFSL